LLFLFVLAAQTPDQAGVKGPAGVHVTKARNLSPAADGRQLTDLILQWMPADTETLVVAQQPFPIKLRDRANIPTALQVAQGYVIGLLASAEDEKLARAMTGHTVRLAVIGARHFRNHTPRQDEALPLGIVAYQGCAIYAFPEAVPEAILSRPSDDSILGERVWTSKGSQNDFPDTDTYLLTFLKPDTMLVCNDREFFRRFVARRKAMQSPRALPAALPEWRQVDRTAPLWAISHYRADGLLAHPLDAFGGLSREPEPTGITLAFGLASGVTRARMISKYDPWKGIAGGGEFQGAAKSRMVADGVWELSISGKPETASVSAFLLMAMVGFIILV
jgi:hypothetical protein